jgi:hypothetical protein
MSFSGLRDRLGAGLRRSCSRLLWGFGGGRRWLLRRWRGRDLVKGYDLLAGAAEKGLGYLNGGSVFVLLRGRVGLLVLDEDS